MSQLENLKEITPKFEGPIQGIWDTFCHVGRELDPNFMAVLIFYLFAIIHNSI